MNCEREHGRFFTRGRVFVLTVLYLGGYGWLRTAGEIRHVEPSSFPGDGRHFVGAGWDLPRWRQQAYRAAFAPLMVAEEEARRVGAGKNARQPRDRVAGHGPDAPWMVDPYAAASPAQAASSPSAGAYAPSYPLPSAPPASRAAATEGAFAGPPVVGQVDERGGMYIMVPETVASGVTYEDDGARAFLHPPVSGMLPLSASRAAPRAAAGEAPERK